MIIRIFMRNFLSFDGDNELSMQASRVSSHPQQVLETIPQPINKLLRLALVFGPNASGKSNLVKALDFIRQSVMKGRILMPNTHFKLQDSEPDTQSKLELDLKCEDRFYRYGFIYDQGHYPQEYLYQIMPTRFKLLFWRKTDGTERQIDWGETVFPTAKDREFYDFVNRSTPEDALLLSELRARKLSLFEVVYKWFERLIIIYPNTRRGDFLQTFSNLDLHKLYRDALIKCDTGISDIHFVDVDPKEVERNIPGPILTKFIQSAQRNKNSLILLHGPKNRYILGFQNEQPYFKMMSFVHNIPHSDKQVYFDYLEESDGTIRLLDLIPLLGDVKNNRIVVIDELDRSLHPLLTKQIIENAINNSQQNESQLIATSHDVNLLDPSLIRRDAIWFVKKNQNMGSTLYSLEEFKPRNDKDLRNAYLEGLYGAIPYL